MAQTGLLARLHISNAIQALMQWHGVRIIRGMSPIAATMALHHMPTGRKGIVAQLNCEHCVAVRAQAMGLRAGKSVEVLGRNGRLLLIQVGATRLAISDDLAQHVEVR